ncbi:MAG: glutamyl-tRNA reductase, partial [Gemmatimonadetes bacterium]|nr:glutamyl-tRNA reductase [Gemmatimonadota bacterium]
MGSRSDSGPDVAREAETIVCVGTSHRVTSVGALERVLAAAAAVVAELGAAVTRGSASLPYTELVLLGTCNRVELYVAGRGDGESARRRLIDALTPDEASAGTRAGSPDRLYVHMGIDAIRHLCRVAAGLDSMVVGEAEIAGQVARAFRGAVHGNVGAPVLWGAAQLAARVSGRARSETGIGRGPGSLNSLAVRIAAEESGGLRGRHVLVLGAGKVSRLACDALRAAAGEGARITVVNRTLERARSLAARVRGRAAALPELGRLLAEADVVLASTRAPRALIDVAMARAAVARRSARDGALVILDLAVPRDVDPEVARVPGIRLFGLDDLRSRLETYLGGRGAHVPAVEAILEEELEAWRRSRDEDVTAVLAALYRSAEALRQRELARALAELDRVDEATRARIDGLTRTLVRRLLHEPATRLRETPDPLRRRSYAEATADLFGLTGTNTEGDPVQRGAGNGAARGNARDRAAKQP